MKRRVRTLYTGRVQGVGFRFTVERIANELNLTGWVKNLRDGRVEVLCEGEEQALKEILVRIDGDMGGYIQRADDEWRDATGEFKDFSIKFL